MTTVSVIGGGIVGASVAYHLAQAGAHTLLVDRHDIGHATAAGAGIISPGTSTGPSASASAPFFKLAQLAATYYPELVATLGEIGQHETRYDVVGELILARTDDEFANLSKLAELFAHRRENGMPNLGKISAVDDQQARELFPPLGPIHGALHLADAARVDGDFMRTALLGGARHHGATFLAGDASLAVAGNKVVGVIVDGENHPVDAVVVATGAWTNTLLLPLGVSVSVAPQRGQILHMTLGETNTSRWPIIGGTGPQYMLTFGPNRVVSGATRETGSGFDVRMTVDGLQSVFNHAMSVAPGLAGATVSEVRIGLRPLSTDGLPFLGMVPGYEGLVIATGHGAGGLMLGPYSGKLAAQLALGEPVATDLRPFAVDRPLISM